MSERLCLEYPLRPGYLAQVVIPRDLTKEEAGRLSAFVTALAQSNEAGPGPAEQRAKQDEKTTPANPGSST